MPNFKSGRKKTGKNLWFWIGIIIIVILIETSEKIGLTMGSIKVNELSPLQRAIFKAEKELLQSALQEYDKFKRIKEELIAEEFSFEIWRDLLNELKLIETSANSSEFIID